MKATESSDAMLFDALHKKNMLSTSLEKSVRSYLDKWGVCVTRAILETRIVSEAKLADIIAEVFGFERIFHLNQQTFPKDMSKIIDYEFARTQNCIPLFSTSHPDEYLIVHHFPLQAGFMESVKSKVSNNVRFGVAEFNEIKNAIHTAYPLTCQMPSMLEGCS